MSRSGKSGSRVNMLQTSQHLVMDKSKSHGLTTKDHDSTNASTLLQLGGGNHSMLSGMHIDASVVLTDFAAAHPSAYLSREDTSEVERQNINTNAEYGEAIDFYLRELETQFSTTDCLL